MTISTINSVPGPASSVEVSFTWSPAGTTSYTAPNGLVLTAPTGRINVSLTFTAVATIYAGRTLGAPLSVVEYRWDFGDGSIGYGQVAFHTYILLNPVAQTVLRVGDSRGRHWYARQTMYLTT